MAYDYGYGTLENKLIALFCASSPDFNAAEALIRQGADINAIGKEDDENILSEILLEYSWSGHGDCNDCGHDRNRNSMIQLCKTNDLRTRWFGFPYEKPPVDNHRGLVVV